MGVGKHYKPVWDYLDGRKLGYFLSLVILSNILVGIFLGFFPIKPYWQMQCPAAVKITHSTGDSSPLPLTYSIETHPEVMKVTYNPHYLHYLLKIVF